MPGVEVPAPPVPTVPAEAKEATTSIPQPLAPEAVHGVETEVKKVTSDPFPPPAPASSAAEGTAVAVSSQAPAESANESAVTPSSAPAEDPAPSSEGEIAKDPEKTEEKADVPEVKKEEKEDATGEKEGEKENPAITKVGSTKFIWPGESVGEEVELDSLKAYHSAPAVDDGSEVTSVILLIHDGLGWTFKNCRLVCDSLARSTGCHVYMPDLFGGESMGLTEAQMSGLMDDQTNMLGRMMQALRIGVAFPKISAFMKKHGPEKTQPLLDKAIEEITKKHGGEKCKLGAVGYSWGAKYALRLGAQHKVAAAVACTPVSAVNPKEDNLKENKAPTLVVLAEKSRVFPDKLWKEVEGVLKESGAPLETLVCAGTKHGFANRCTESVPAACKGKDDAFLKTVSWFSQYLK